VSRRLSYGGLLADFAVQRMFCVGACRPSLGVADYVMTSLGPSGIRGMGRLGGIIEQSWWRPSDSSSAVAPSDGESEVGPSDAELPSPRQLSLRCARQTMWSTPSTRVMGGDWCQATGMEDIRRLMFICPFSRRLPTDLLYSGSLMTRAPTFNGANPPT